MIIYETLKRYCDIFGIKIDDCQLKKFDVYYSFLIEYNRKINLTSIVEPVDVVIKHFLDSIIVSKFIMLNGKIIDIGSGAGFPGVPLKIVNPNLDLILLDSSKKKANFLKELSGAVGLKFEILNDRAEKLSKYKEFRQSFDFSISRAVAPLNILSELCLPFVKLHGKFIAMKGLSCIDELEKSKGIIPKLGGKIKYIGHFDLPDNYGSRYFIIIEKVSNTPIKYPRSYSNIISSFFIILLTFVFYII